MYILFATGFGGKQNYIICIIFFYFDYNFFFLILTTVFFNQYKEHFQKFEVNWPKKERFFGESKKDLIKLAITSYVCTGNFLHSWQYLKSQYILFLFCEKYFIVYNYSFHMRSNGNFCKKNKLDSPMPLNNYVLVFLCILYRVTTKSGKCWKVRKKEKKYQEIWQKNALNTKVYHHYKLHFANVI